jgi:hypothetical protein
MAYTVDRVDVWMGFVPDSAGEMGKVLATLSQAGANLEFVFGRAAKAGKAVFFLAPLKGAAQLRSAKNARIVKQASTSSLRVSGPNKAGLGAKITQALGQSGINVQGLSAMSIGNTSMCYLALKKADVAQAQRILKKVL